jgi:uncharacterized protein (TIGR02271 family)
MKGTSMSDPKYSPPTETQVLPILEETLDVQTRQVETGRVRLSKVVRERAETVDEPLLREEVTVERKVVNRRVEHPPTVRQAWDTLIIPVVEEILVVEKRLMLKEELHITTRRVEEHKPQTVTLRREEVRMERLPPQDPLTSSVRKES